MSDRDPHEESSFNPRAGFPSPKDYFLALRHLAEEGESEASLPTDRDPREETLFSQAVRLPTPEERTAYLTRACGSDQKLRQRLGMLIRAHQQACTTVGPSATTASDSDHSADITEKPGDHIGRYKLLRRIGEGGCGVVYMAEQEEPVRRRVALKVIKLGMDTKRVIARFEAERQALAMMDHPGIAKVFDAGATGTGRPYFVMELVRGVRITDYCEQNHLPIGERLNLFIKACQAIQHAHQKGIIHRDVKPSNILVSLHDGVPLPKVIDFGIAKATTDQRLTNKTLFTAQEQLVGTPAYMSPEQAEMSGLDVDTRSDVYSLGVLLYELLTGKTPFDSQTMLEAGLDEIRRKIREDEPPRPSTRLSTMLAAELTTLAKHRKVEPPKLIISIRGDLDWIVMKCLEKDRTRRYETANDLAHDAQRFLQNEPVVARPPSRLYRFQKLVRRNQVVFASSAVVAFALVAGFAISTRMFLLEKKAHERAVAAERIQATLRQEAEANEKIAETQAKKSQQVAEFMKAMLEAVGPSVALGRDTTMLREILDKTAERVGRDLQGQPEVEAELRNTIGLAYAEIGQTDKAEAMHWEALRLRKALFGEAHATVAESFHNLASVLWHRERLADAEQMARQALVLRKQFDGERHESVAESLNLLGVILQHRQDMAGARAAIEEALRLRRARFGEFHSKVAESLSDLGEILRLSLDFEGAERMQRQALAIRKKLFGELHPDVAESLSQLAEVLRKRHDYAGAEAAQREALALRVNLAGWDHPSVALTLDLLTATFQERGDSQALSTLLEELTRIEPVGVHLLRFRAGLFARRARWSEAITDLNKVLLLDPQQQEYYHCLAALFVQTTNLPGYQQICRQMLARFGKTTEPSLAERMTKDCLMLSSSGADPTVVSRLADLSVKAAEKYSPHGWYEFAAGLAAYRQGQYDDAVRWTRKTLRSVHYVRSVEAYMVLAMAHQQLKQTRDARQALADGLEYARKNMPRLETGDLGRDWLDWIIAQALMREATAMVGIPSSAHE